MATSYQGGLLNFSGSNPSNPLSRNPALFSDAPHSGRAFASPLYLSTPLNNEPSLGLDNEAIETLALKYSAVVQILQLRDSLSQQLIRSNEQVGNLYDDLRQLRDENRVLQEKLNSQTCSPMAELVKVLSTYEKPTTRPEQLPFGVLWNIEDARNDPDAAPSASNPSRFNIEMILRELDGRVIPREKAKAATTVANMAYRTHLENLKGPTPGRPAPLQYLRAHHGEQVSNALNDIERQVPQAGFCSFRWKGLHMLQHHIQNRSNSAGKKKKSTQKASDGSVDPVLSETLDDRAPEAPPPSGSGAKRKSPEQDDGKEASSSNGNPTAKRTKNHKLTATKASFESGMVLSGGGGGGNEKVQGPGAGGLNDGKAVGVNIAHIRVDASYDNIRAVLLSEPEYASLEHVGKLLDRLKLIAASAATVPPPSNDVCAFLSRIEDANPSSPDISEDDNNLQWGHYQFTAGNLTISRVLTSWDSVGGVPIAYRFLAAAIKTHRVAVSICFQRKIKGKPTLSFIYLSHLVEQLWDLVKDIETVEQDKAPDLETVNPTAAARDHVNKLCVADLNKWIDDNQIQKVANKKYKKPDLVDLIMGSSAIPSHSYVVAASKRNKDARKV